MRQATLTTVDQTFILYTQYTTAYTKYVYATCVLEYFAGLKLLSLPNLAQYMLLAIHVKVFVQPGPNSKPHF